MARESQYQPSGTAALNVKGKHTEITGIEGACAGAGENAVSSKHVIAI
jgi:hypothetical protein